MWSRGVSQPFSWGWTLIGILVVLLAIGLAVPMPFHGPGVGSLSDLCHAPVFALVAFLIFAVAKDGIRRSAILTSIVCGIALVAAGAVMEVVQAFVGRQPSVGDVLANAGGTLAGGLFYHSRRIRWQWSVVTVLVGIAILVRFTLSPAFVVADAIRQRREMPLIASFESARELRRWTGQACSWRMDSRHATHGDSSLRVELQPGRFPGVRLETAPLWAGYEQLQFDCFLAGSEPLTVVVKIHDWHHNGELDDRFNRRIVLAPGGNRITIPLQEIVDAPAARELDMRAIEGFSLFAVRLRAGRTIYLDEIRLTPE